MCTIVFLLQAPWLRVTWGLKDGSEGSAPGVRINHSLLYYKYLVMIKIAKYERTQTIFGLLKSTLCKCFDSEFSLKRIYILR